MSTRQTTPNRSQHWFPGLYVPVRHIRGIEIFPSSRRIEVGVLKTTLHGTVDQLYALAADILDAIERAEQQQRMRAA
ncbi:hypothetical protein ACIBG8_46775 [Nonomuraea sp. NPDC050556]|uniref:hypothetical protein n=1 Tax=Nonomuraea sp. NPDC050556 TaxID=3364369 RepID=UPI0037B543A5